MENFQVEKAHTTAQFVQRTKELILQIEGLQNFYANVLDLNSENMQTIFGLTLGYLKGKVELLVIKSFFDVLMNQNKLNTEKEINLLVCFENLIDSYEDEYENFLKAADCNSDDSYMNVA